MNGIIGSIMAAFNLQQYLTGSGEYKATNAQDQQTIWDSYNLMQYLNTDA